MFSADQYQPTEKGNRSLSEKYLKILCSEIFLNPF